MLFYPLGGPIISGFLECLGLLIPLCLPIHAKLSKVWGFPLFARVSKGLGFPNALRDPLSAAPYMLPIKVWGFSLIRAARFIILIDGYFKLSTTR